MCERLGEGACVCADMRVHVVELLGWQGAGQGGVWREWEGRRGGREGDDRDGAPAGTMVMCSRECPRMGAGRAPSKHHKKEEGHHGGAEDRAVISAWCIAKYSAYPVKQWVTDGTLYPPSSATTTPHPSEANSCVRYA